MEVGKVNWPPAQLNDYEARHMRQPEANAGGCESESRLHAKILADCAEWGWLVGRSRMDRPTGRQAGEPDFRIMAPGGVALSVEVKTAKGKLSPEQLAYHAHAKKLGHVVFTVRSYDSWRLIADGVKGRHTQHD
jgi:hypothetical protein